MSRGLSPSGGVWLIFSLLKRCLTPALSLFADAAVERLGRRGQVFRIRPRGRM